ncbi:MAG: MFS transporter [Acetobacter sp.]
MLHVLRHRTYRHLFGAQLVALTGTGLATVALGLLAFRIAGQNAGAVLGTALAIKMAAYVGVAPLAAAFANHLPRRTTLVLLDLARGLVAACLPFVNTAWQIYALIFVLQSASAAFTPTFQATIPDILPDEEEYTEALSLSRIAYDMESVLSPLLAAALLGVVSFHALFAGTAVGFLCSAALVVSVRLPSPKVVPHQSVFERTTRGIRLYLATPRLRGLLSVDLAVAAATSIVLVNTVVYVQAHFGLGQSATAVALACFGAGSVLAALGLPRVLARWADRTVMLGGACLLCVAAGLAVWVPSYGWLLPLWAVLGMGYSIAQTPSGRLLRRSGTAEDRPALFAAQFSLSHLCWLLAYPLAGRMGAAYGLPAAAMGLCALAVVATLVARRVWPAGT